MRALSWLFYFTMVQQACAVPHDSKSETQPLPPSEDPWYTAPPHFASRAPGEILRTREAPGNLTDVVGNATTAYHILFRTTDGRDEPSWAVTTLFIPETLYSSPSGNAALLSYQLAYNSANLDSAPSIGLYWRMAANNPDLGLTASTVLIDELLGLGWIVNTPDYLGPLSVFGSGVYAGRATLDSMKAAISFVRSKVSPDGVTVAMWGYSGGSLATGAAAERAASYAPDLDIAGTVLGGLVDDLSADLALINESPIAASVVSFLLGVTAQFPKARRYLESILRPETKDEFMSVADINVADASKLLAGRDMYAYFKNGAADLQAPILRELYKSQTRIGVRGTPEMPMFVYKAVHDEFCPIDQTDATVKRWCDAGAEIRFDRNSVGGHVAEIGNGKPRVVEWLWGIFDETYKPGAERCVVKDVTVDLSSQKK